jgi:hypothetical protein
MYDYNKWESATPRRKNGKLMNQIIGASAKTKRRIIIAQSSTNRKRSMNHLLLK